MKITRFVLPVSILALVAIMCAVLINKGATSDNENQLALGLGLFFVFILNIVPLALFIPFGVALLICELCLFFVRNPKGTMIAVIILMLVLLAAVVFVAFMMGSIILEISLLHGAMIIGGAVLYGLSYVAIITAYAIDRKNGSL